MKKQTHNHTLATILSVASLLLSGLLFVLALPVLTTYYRGDEVLLDNLHRIRSDAAQVRFCYDNDIKPCDEPEIEAWNEANPDSTFNIYR